MSSTPSPKAPEPGNKKAKQQQQQPQSNKQQQQQEQQKAKSPTASDAPKGGPVKSNNNSGGSKKARQAPSLPSQRTPYSNKAAESINKKKGSPQEDDEEDDAPPREPSDFIVSIIIALVFISLPLSEPNIDWVVVGVFATINLLWIVFMHRPELVYYAALILTNFVVVQLSERMNELPGIVAKQPWYVFAELVGINVATVLLFRHFWAPRIKSRAEREDLMLSTVIIVNVVNLIVTGIIPLSLLKEASRNMYYLFLRFITAN